jgi:hypothetical protein
MMIRRGHDSWGVPMNIGAGDIDLTVCRTTAKIDRRANLASLVALKASPAGWQPFALRCTQADALT